MKFRALDLELHLTQNFCHTYTDIFQKYSNRVQDIPKRVNTSKIGSCDFFQTNTFFINIQEIKEK